MFQRAKVQQPVTIDVKDKCEDNDGDDDDDDDDDGGGGGGCGCGGGGGGGGGGGVVVSVDGGGGAGSGGGGDDDDGPINNMYILQMVVLILHSKVWGINTLLPRLTFKKSARAVLVNK